MRFEETQMDFQALQLETISPFLKCKYRRTIAQHVGLVHPYANDTQEEFPREKLVLNQLVSDRTRRREAKWIKKRDAQFSLLIDNWLKKFNELYPTVEKQEAYYWERIKKEKGSQVPFPYRRGPSTLVNEEWGRRISGTEEGLQGLFTNQPIAAGELIGLYLGKTYKRKAWEQLPDHKQREAYSMDVWYPLTQKSSSRRFQSRVLDASDLKEASFTRYLNTPFLGERNIYENTGFQSVYMGNILVVGLFSIRKISADEELCAYYGPYGYSRYALVRYLAQKESWKKCLRKRKSESNKRGDKRQKKGVLKV